MIILKHGQAKTLFDLVGELQKKKKGCFFCSLSFNWIKNGISVRKTSYFPLRDELIPKKLAFMENEKVLIFKRAELPARVEHLLQIVRNSFPGTGFQFISVLADAQNFIITNDLKKK